MFRHKIPSIVIGCVLVLGCKDNPSGETKNAVGDAKRASAVNVCKILSGEEVGRAMGLSIKETHNTLQMADEKGTRVVSQCSYNPAESGQAIGVMLRYAANETNPTSLDGAIALLSRGLDEKSSTEVAEAIKKGTTVSGLGEIAIWYSYSEAPTMVLFFNKHYQLIINTPYQTYNSQTMERAKLLASQVMQKIK